MRMLCIVILVAAAVVAFAEPNPPVWPSSVKILDPATPALSQQIVDAVFSENGECLLHSSLV